MFPFMLNNFNHQFVEQDTIHYSSHVYGLIKVLTVLNTHDQCINKAKIRSNDCDVQIINQILTHTLVFDTIESLHFDLINYSSNIQSQANVLTESKKLFQSILPNLPSLKQFYVSITASNHEAYESFVESFNYELNNNMYPKLNFFMICLNDNVDVQNISFKPLSGFLRNHAFQKLGLELYSGFPFNIYSQLISALVDKTSNLEYLHIESSADLTSRQCVELLSKFLVAKGKYLSTFKFHDNSISEIPDNTLLFLMQTMANNLMNVDTLHLDLNIKPLQLFVELLNALCNLQTLHLKVRKENLFSVNDMGKLFHAISTHRMLNDVTLNNIWYHVLYIEQLSQLFSNYNLKKLSLQLTSGISWNPQTITDEQIKLIDAIHKKHHDTKQIINDNIIVKLLKNQLLYDCVIKTIEMQLESVWNLPKIFISQILQYIFGASQSNKMILSVSKYNGSGAEPYAWKIGEEFKETWNDIWKQYKIDNNPAHFHREVQAEFSWM